MSTDSLTDRLQIKKDFMISLVPTSVGGPAISTMVHYITTMFHE